ncbi:MAG: DUF4386 domain-containing protein [Gammaproteobacteria bacterium]|nr:DUF4386 domain-containing protein [Gammaproteobacteria bacterium]
MIDDISSTKKKARIAGFIYLLLVITGVVSLLYIPSQFIVRGDATATANNILSSEPLFRAGIFLSFITQIVYVFLALALYRLLKEISHPQALLMVTLVVIGASTAFANTFNEIAALIILSGDDFLSVIERPQLEALSYVFLRLHSYALQGIQIFWGLWLFPFGYLVYRSRFIPKILGVLLFIAGLAYVLSSFTFFVLPQYTTTISPLITFLEMAELPIVFWLLIVGAKAQSSE